MRRKTHLGGPGLGILFATTTAVIWGGQFVVGKTALARVDSFPLTAIRYALAATIMLGVLAWREGPAALRLGGRGRELFALGALGFAGFNLLAYTGLAHARPQSAALIVALGPLVTAFVLWLRDGVRPARATVVALAVALAGIALVVSGGHPETIVQGSIGWGDGLVFLGVTAFTLYTLGAARHSELSPLRFTALTMGLGWVAVAGATAVALSAGLVPTPSGADVAHVTPEILYLAIPGAALAVLTWNAAVPRIGAQNVALIGNLIPVTTFTIQIARGYRPVALELAGAALVLVALTANNLLLRRADNSARAARGEARQPGELEAEAA